MRSLPDCCENARTWLGISVLCVLLLGLGARQTARGAEADAKKITESPAAMVTKVNIGLRKAQSMMFSGKKDLAIEEWKTAASLIETIKAADPKNTKLKSLEQKAEKLRKDLERRTGKTLSLKPAGAADAKSKPEPPKPPKPPISAAIKAMTPDALAKHANKMLSQSQRSMMSGKKDQAIEELFEAADALEQLKKTDPKNSKLSGMESKANRQAGDLSRRSGKTIDLEARTAMAPAAPPKTGGTPPPKTGGAAPGAKLPAGVTKRLKSIDTDLKRVEASLAGATAALSGDDSQKAKNSIGQAKYKLSGVAGTMGEIDRMYGDKIPPGHPEMKAVQDRIAKAETEIKGLEEGLAQNDSAADAKTKQSQADSAVWLRKFEPYVSPPYSGDKHNAEKYFICSYTSNVVEINKRKKLFDELSALFAEYQKAEFTAGKTDALQKLEKEVAADLKEFPEIHQRFLDNGVENADKSMDQALQFLADDKWKSDVKIRPLPLNKDAVPGIEKLIGDAEKAAPAGDLKIAALKSKLTGIVAKNKERRTARTARTFLTPDKFSGGELKTIKAKADAVAKEKIAGVKVLRITVISPEWKEERVLEPTDSTNTAIRYRVTRSVTAQVAGKSPAGVFLYTLYVGKDKQGSGWSALKSHIMFTDPMLEENVNKKAP